MRISLFVLAFPYSRIVSVCVTMTWGDVLITSKLGASHVEYELVVAAGASSSERGRRMQCWRLLGSLCSGSAVDGLRWS